MKRYAVSIEDSAQADVQRSYDWGRHVWGRRQAQKWALELRAAIINQLATVPRGFPLAPESDEFEEEVRQLIVGRYRVLFTIRARKVHVLHVRGAYIGASRSDVFEE